MILSTQFKQQMQDLLQDEYLAFETTLQEKSPVSIRLNPDKPEHSFSNLEKVPWHPQAYYLEARPNFTLDPFFHAGHYYVQEASSMILSQVIEQLDINKNSLCLDFCAAPGGKSSLLLDYLSDQGILHAHEFNGVRASVLKQNLHRWGRANTIISAGRTDQFIASGLQYDLILVDAPCSGEGMFRKEEKAIEQWNKNKVEQCSLMQRDVLTKAFQLCKPGGYIIYSTCTYNRIENEEICQSTMPSNFISLDIDLNKFPLHKSQYKNILTYRCLPHRIKGEGFSFTIFQNTNSNVPFAYQGVTRNIKKINLPEPFDQMISQDEFNQAICLKDEDYLVSTPMMAVINALQLARIQILSAGLPIGHFKGKDWYPHHALSQSVLLAKNFPSYGMVFNESIDYLRANNNFLHAGHSSTWQIATYQSARLGWIKKTSDRLKNYLPKELRIISY